MAKVLWRKQAATTTTSKKGSSPVRAGDRGVMPRGYVPMRLVGDGGEEHHHETILVPVALLKEPGPGMVELLEMAERQYGYGQPGVLRIPCDARRFQQLMGLECMAT